jgi:hypothetical protein
MTENDKPGCRKKISGSRAVYPSSVMHTSGMRELKNDLSDY